MKTDNRIVTGAVLERIFSDEAYLLERLARKEMVSEHQLDEYGYTEDLLKPIVRRLIEKGLITKEDLNPRNPNPEDRYFKLTARGRFELGLLKK